MAAANCSKELVELLLEKGADVNAVGADSLTAFTHAITGILSESVTTTDIAELLLEKGANVDEAAPSGRIAGYTCLMMAARNARPDLVKFLVEKGANVNARAGDGNTPLSLAREEKDEEMVKFLMELGAEE
jgi:ankyrin repeat protein